MGKAVEANLFSTLFTYKTGENQFTSALFYLLRRLWCESTTRGHCCRLLSSLCGLGFTPDDNLEFSIQPVIHKAWKRKRRIVPDMVIQSPSADRIAPQVCVLLEVKDECPANRAQVRSYKRHLAELQRDGCETTCLVLLRHHTGRKRDQLSVGSKPGALQKEVEWRELYRLLTDLKGYVHDGVNRFVIEDFITFLKEKGMFDLERVTPEFEKGFRETIALLGILKTAVVDLYGIDKVVEDFDIGRYLGFWFFWHPKISVGIKGDQPDELRMYIDRNRLDQKKCVQALTSGILREDKDYDDEQVYVCRCLAAVYSTDDQVKVIRDYVADMHSEIRGLQRQ